MVYPKTPDHLTLEMPLAYQVLPPQAENYGFKILNETETAGVIVYYPQAVAYGDNI